MTSTGTLALLETAVEMASTTAIKVTCSSHRIIKEARQEGLAHMLDLGLPNHHMIQQRQLLKEAVMVL